MDDHIDYNFSIIILVKIPNIVEAAAADPSLSTLVQAVTAAELVDTLSGDGPFTVFAPNNDAFDKIPAKTLANLLKPKNKDKLTEILLRHVVPKALKSGDIPKGGTFLDTAGGEPIIVTSENGVTITSTKGNATVIKADILASNGIIHIVDTVF